MLGKQGTATSEALFWDSENVKYKVRARGRASRWPAPTGKRSRSFSYVLIAMVNQTHFGPACAPTSSVCFLQTFQWLAFHCQKCLREGDFEMASVNMHRGNVLKQPRAEALAPAQPAPSVVKNNAGWFTRLVAERTTEPCHSLLPPRAATNPLEKTEMGSGHSRSQQQPGLRSRAKASPRLKALLQPQQDAGGADSSASCRDYVPLPLNYSAHKYFPGCRYLGTLCSQRDTGGEGIKISLIATRSFLSTPPQRS